MKTQGIILSTCLAMVAGCAPMMPETNERLGQFTAASSFNVRNLEYERANGTSTQVLGKSCYKADPATLKHLEGPKDNLIQRAMDDAIRQGQAKGLDGDLLVNARIEKRTEIREKDNFLRTKERFECVYVEGDLVKVKA